MMSASLRGRRRSIANFRNTDRVRLSSLVRRTALTDQRNWAALASVCCPHARARRAETDPLDLVEPPGRRCGNFFLVIFFLANCCWQSWGDDDVGFATGSSTIDRQFPQHRQSALVLARATHRSDRSAELGSVRSVCCPHARARRAETDPLDLVEPPGRRCGNFFLVIFFLANCCWQSLGRR